jgi:transposase InsO family protein
MGGSTLNRMISSGANLGLVFKEASSFILCHVCNTCKATRPAVRNLTGKERSALPSPLHELYMDIHGPINPESVLGYRYVLGFICSATGYAFIYFLKRKSESARAFKDLVLFLLSHKTLPVAFEIYKLTLICDNAGEFTSSEFQEIMEKHNIKQQLTSPYAHHQALFIERLWRTLADASRTMLATAGLDFIYWPLAFRHAVHVYRLMPHRTREQSVACLRQSHRTLNYLEPSLISLIFVYLEAMLSRS